MYGVDETNPLADGGTYHENVDRERTYSLAALAQAGGKITRLRLLTEPGYPYYDVSYVHGTLPDGRVVPVQATTANLRKSRLKADLIEWAKEEGVYAKGVGLLDEGNWSTVR